MDCKICKVNKSSTKIGACLDCEKLFDLEVDECIICEEGEGLFFTGMCLDCKPGQPETLEEALVSCPSCFVKVDRPKQFCNVCLAEQATYY